MAQRRYYVQSSAGELGPHNRLELRGLVRNGTITREARLRTAFGAAAGTVGELLDAATDELPSPDDDGPEVVLEVPGAPKLESATDRVAKSDRALAAARKPATGAAGRVSTPPPPTRRPPVVLMVVIVLVIALAIGWWMKGP